jgi:Na+-transporting methylmalonyl-CoA/oxaloacetate decarboxylase gamma subunit
MENLNTALLLMVVGMATVFAILLIVINLGKALIALVNKYTYGLKEPVTNRTLLETEHPQRGDVSRKR